ncbi:hypothetical protein DPMN_041690 [Dreissena polymorpha]|uniref:Uncharacterized protein n=1 Tax=Dreissena polymorpha TaxID=45954 RepID=A0A9D4CXP6_DREPO|nr:hypothetical protein DPMN_041690 [Dreissena polymorpha]
MSYPAFAITQSTKDLPDVYDSSSSSTNSTTSDHVNSTSGSLIDNDKMLEDGAVTIHVNNVSNPSVPSSARSGTSSERLTAASECVRTSHSNSVSP